MMHVCGSIPPMDREAETGASDFQIGPTSHSLGCEGCHDSGPFGDQLPCAVRLFAHDRIAGSRRAKAECAAFADDRLRSPVSVHVPHCVDTARNVAGGAGIVATSPLLANSLEPRGVKCTGLVRERHWHLSGCGCVSHQGNDEASERPHRVPRATRVAFVGSMVRPAGATISWYPHRSKRLFATSHSSTVSERRCRSESDQNIRRRTSDRWPLSRSRMIGATPRLGIT